MCAGPTGVEHAREEALRAKSGCASLPVNITRTIFPFRISTVATHGGGPEWSQVALQQRLAKEDPLVLRSLCSLFLQMPLAPALRICFTVIIAVLCLVALAVFSLVLYSFRKNKVASCAEQTDANLWCARCHTLYCSLPRQVAHWASGGHK